MALVEGTNCGFVTSAPSADPTASSNPIDNYARVSKFTSPAGAITVTEIGWWCDGATEEANFEVCIYDHDAGNDKAKDIVGVSRTNAKGTTSGWKKATGLSISITGNTIYWIGVQLDDVATETRTNYDSQSYRWGVTASGATTLPDPWDGSAESNALMAFYAIYTTTGNVGMMTTKTGYWGPTF